MIDSQLLDAYIAELDALRVHGRDLARTYPDIAGRLDIGPRRSRDAQVERVVESSAFIAARLRLMIESTATELPLAVLTMLAPSLVEPVPSMALLGFRGGSEEEVIPKGTRFDYMLAGQALLCFSTTMPITISPVTLKLRRLEPSRGAPDGIGITLQGEPPATKILFCFGNDDLTSAILLDGLSDKLSSVELVPPGDGMPRLIPRSALQICGFSTEEAALPIRPGAHKAARLVTEFLVFPEKFRFVSLSGVPLQSGSEILLRFRQPLALPPRLPPDLISVNKVPAVNLWSAAATPFDVDGRQLEFPVRVDALRYRTVECHSVESIDLYSENSNQPVRIDPIIAFGNVRGSSVRWGIRRSSSRAGAEVLLYFQGLDYRTLGHQRYLVAPRVLASNGDIPRRAVVGTLLQSVEGGMGGWQTSLVTAPTSYQPGVAGSRAMETLIGYMYSSMNSFVGVNKSNLLRDYLGRFPGSGRASWINGIRSVSLRPISVVRNGKPHTGLALLISFDSQRYKMTSQFVLKRVLGELFESQRGINRVEEIWIQ